MPRETWVFACLLKIIYTCCMSLFVRFIIVIPLVFLLGISAVSFSFPVFAQQISPAVVGSDAQFGKSWFVETIKPGELVSRSVRIDNPLARAMNLTILAKDSTITSDGAFTFINSNEENKEVGGWISLSSNSIYLNAGESKTVDFTITVPQNTPSGEYAGVVAIQEINPQTTSPNNPLTIQQRIGTRVYITVPGQLTTGGNISEFNALLPDKNGYNQWVKLSASSQYNQASLNVKIANTGNVFTKLSGVVSIQTPSKKYTQDFDRDFSPRKGDSQFTLGIRDENKVPVAWEVGDYSISLDVKESPLISSNKPSIQSVSEKKNTSIQFSVTQQMIDTIEKDTENYKKQYNQQIQAGKDSGAEFMVKGVDDGSVQNNVFNTNLLYFLVPVVLLFVVSGGYIGYRIWKRKSTQSKTVE